MFHFLVKSNGWVLSQDTISIERVFEYTDKSISEQFMPNGLLDSERITSIPALFASETNVKAAQLARVGHITRVRNIGNQISIDYAYDVKILPVSNVFLEKYSKTFDISSFEFSRTHWAIKDVDLFKVLLQMRPAVLNLPKVFQLNETYEPNEKLISAMMPFDSRFDEVYNALKHVANELNLECLRADDIWQHDAVIQDIVSLINRSKIVICDCTGRNANVFYEAGIAHTLGREVILITQSKDDIPFDLRHLRYISYLNNNEGREKLSKQLKPRIETILSSTSNQIA